MSTTILIRELLTFATDGNLKELSGEEVWEAIENFAEVEMHRNIAWDKVENLNPQSTPQVLPSFEEYTPPGLNTCNHDIPLSSREVPSFDKMKPQPQPLPTYPPLDISLGDKRGLKPPIKPHSPDSFRMKEVDHLTNNTPPSPHVVSFHPKDTYCYYHLCIGDPKKHYGFKPCLLGLSESLGVDFSKLGMIEDDWELESKEVSFLGRELNSPVRPKEVENVRIKETPVLFWFESQNLTNTFSTYGSFSPPWCVPLLSPALELKCRGTFPFIC
ncbi:hypothetical protein Tco_0818295 [Tanacetum coccineum]